MTQQFMKDEGEWFDEFLSPANLSQDKLLGRMVTLHYLLTDDVDMFMVKGESALATIEHAPDGSILDVADYLDTDPPFGLA